MANEMGGGGNDGRPAVHCIGIGGIGVSALARILHREGHTVTGSDLEPSPLTRELSQLGIAVALGHRPENVPAGAALVICSAAIRPGHPELEEAERRGIPVLKYAQALGRLMAGRRGIAVSGTHGKTTTTAMVAHLLTRAGLDPTMVVGGMIPSLGGTSRVGRSDLIVVEACEYDRSFLNLTPTYAVVTNIEADHLDYYRDLAEIREAFRAFAARVPAEGRILVCAEDPGAVAAVSGLPSPVETYAIEDRAARWRAAGVDLSGGRPSYTLVHGEDEVGRVALLVPGRHNVLNSLAAIGAAHAAGVPVGAAAEAIASFPGVNRRFQVLGECGGAKIVDDYAHHPTKVRSTIRAARQRFAGARIVAVFQPHQHSRTRHFLADFAAALGEADRVILSEIYAARDSEAERKATTARDLAGALAARGVAVTHIPSFEGIAAHLGRSTGPGDVILVMGAGDIYRLAEALVGAGRTGGGLAA